MKSIRINSSHKNRRTISPIYWVSMIIMAFILYFVGQSPANAADRSKELWKDTNPAQYNSYAAPEIRQLHESPSFFAMTGDLLVARPLMLAVTAIGMTVFIVSSPFSALGGNISQAAKTLVKQPANYTFTRCLGCTGMER